MDTFKQCLPASPSCSVIAATFSCLERYIQRDRQRSRERERERGFRELSHNCRMANLKFVGQVSRLDPQAGDDAAVLRQVFFSGKPVFALKDLS